MQINFNYGKALSDANQLESYANELDALVNNRIEPLITKLDSSWKGESATMMINKCIIEKANVTEHASKLRRNASNLRAAAEQIRRAEEEAIELLKRKEAELAKRLTELENEKKL